MHYIRRLRGAGAGPMFRDSRRGLPPQNNGVKRMLRRLGRLACLPKVHADRFWLSPTLTQRHLCLPHVVGSERSGNRLWQGSLTSLES